MKESLYHQDRLQHNQTFFKGCKAGMVIALGYIPIAIAFGLLAKATGIPNYISVMMSFFIFAGASQFVGIKMIALGATHWELIMTTFILNFRHFLMSITLSQRVESGTSRKWLSLISFGITDETYSVMSLMREDKLSAAFIFGLNFIAFSAWNVGTLIGLSIASGISQSIQSSMGIALYVMFIGLLIPSIRKSKIVFFVSLISIGICAALQWIPFFQSLSSGWSIVISSVIASSIGAILFPEEESEH